MAKIDYADGILQLRAKLNLSQEKLAKMLGGSYISVELKMRLSCDYT